VPKWGGGCHSSLAGAKDLRRAPPLVNRLCSLGKTRVGVKFCHMLENHDPCHYMFWPLDQTDMALDALD